MQSHPTFESRVLTAWQAITGRIVCRGVPRISSLLCSALLPADSVTVSARGYRMIVNKESYYDVCTLCDCLNRHLTNLIAALLERGDVFVDGGANIGQIAFLAATIVGPGGKVIAYEPNAALAARLDAQRLVNQYHWMIIRSAALGATAGVMEFFVHKDTQLSSFFMEHDQQHSVNVDKIKVDVVTLDDELCNYQLADKGLHLIKLDLEGGEREALLGMHRTLTSATPPACLVELNPGSRKDSKDCIGSILNTFNKCGYSCYVVDKPALVIGRQWPKLLPMSVMLPYAVDALFVHPRSLVYRRMRERGMIR